MKKLVTAAALALCLSASTAFAQADGFDVGVFGDEAGTMSTMAVNPFVPFNLYVVGFGLGDVFGYELSISGTEGMSVLALTLNPANAINIGNNLNWIVGTGACLTAGPTFRVGTLNLIALSAVPADRAVCVRPATPSSFGGLTPGYLRCDNSLQAFGVAQNGGGVYPDGCMILNATGVGPVSTESTSFGDVKARF